MNIHPVKYKLNGLDIVANVYTPGGLRSCEVLSDPRAGTSEWWREGADDGPLCPAPRGAGLHYHYRRRRLSGWKRRRAAQHRQAAIPVSRTSTEWLTSSAASPGVDTARLGLFGICGGGGYSLSAAKTDKRFKAVATLSMFNSGRVRRNGFQDSQMETIQQRLQQASAARAQETAGGEVLYSGDANLTDAQIAALPFDLYREGYEYYWRTHAHPGSTFKYTTSSLMDLMRWDATDEIALIDVPLLMIAGSAADTLYMTEDAFPKATGTTDKELFKIEGAKHIETYWVPEYVDAALSRLKPFFDRHLASA